MPALLIRGGRVVDPTMRLDAVRDVRILDGIVTEIGERLQAGEGETLLDASGAIVAPGFVDMHVHLREPGYPEKETIATGTEAAVRGGFTSVACMPNTNPALDDPATLTLLRTSIAEHARCRVYPIGALTSGRQGREPCDYSALASAGAVAFSDDGDTVQDATVMREAAVRGLEVGQVFIAHCEPEELIVARDLGIAQETGKNWHVAHCSSGTSLDLIRSARAAGLGVTCEATPHHLTFTDVDAREIGPAARVNPPLRSERDVAALRQGVLDGTVNALATDHAPHTAQEKSSASGIAAPGFSGLEVAVGAYAAALSGLPMMRFVELLSTNPARILGIAGGTLRGGAPADVTIFADRDWVVDPSRFASKGRSTPFAGRRLPRQVLATIVDGTIRYKTVEFGT
jgi:dihydroorotase